MTFDEHERSIAILDTLNQTQGNPNHLTGRCEPFTHKKTTTMAAINANALSSRFPEFTDPPIHRENILISIEETFKSTATITINGTGKTHIAAQFAARHSSSTVSLFIASSSKYTYDPETHLYDACNQLNYILNESELTPDTPASELLLKKLISTSSKRRRGPSQTIYFVIDGLCDIPPQQEYVRTLIFDWLPFGMPAFKFLLSGECFANLLQDRQTKHRSIPIPGLTYAECEQMLGTTIDKEVARQVYTITRGNPEFIAGVARIAKQQPINSNNIPESLAAILELEWQQTTRNQSAETALAALAFADTQFTIETLAAITNTNSEQLKQDLASTHIITIANDSQTASFTTDSHRGFVQKKLQHLRAETDQKIADWLMKEPDEVGALTLLPSYLSATNRRDELFSYLDSDRLALMVERSHLRSAAIAGARRGVTAASAHNKDDQLLRLAMSTSQIHEYSSLEVSMLELGAKLALGGYDEASAMAERAPLRGDRLHLFAAIARHQKENGLAITDDIHDSLVELSKTIDTRSGPEVEELAADLMYSLPDTALQLLERSTDPTKVRTNDWTYARLSLEARSAGLTNETTLATLREKIKNPVVSNTIDTFALFLRNHSARDVLNQAENLTTTANKLLFFRQWARQTRDNESASSVLTQAINLLISSTETTPTALALSELSTALPLVRAPEDAKRLIAEFDAAGISTKEAGPSEAYTQLQLNLATCENSFSSSASKQRLAGLYEHLLRITNISTRATCLAMLKHALAKPRPNDAIDSADELHSSVAEQLNNDIAAILSSSADHEDATQSIIQQLATNNLDIALGVAGKLNIQPRREVATLRAIRSHIHANKSAPRLDLIVRHLNQVTDPDDLQTIVQMSLRAIVDIESDEYLRTNARYVTVFINRSEKAFSLETRAQSVALAHIASLRLGTRNEELAESVLDTLSMMDETPVKAEIAFVIATELAQHDVELARKLIRIGETSRPIAGSREQANLVVHTLKLTIRAFSALLARKQDRPADLHAISHRLENVASLYSRAKLTSELLLQLHIHDRTTDAKTVGTQLRGVLETLRSFDRGLWSKAMVFCFSALYANHKSTALELLEPLNDETADSAINHALRLVVDGIIPGDAPGQSEPESNHSVVDYNVATDIVELLRHCRSDALLAVGIQRLSEAVSPAKGRNSLSKEQSANIRARLIELANSKFPNAKYITHNGYKLSTLADLFRLKTDPPIDLNALTTDARTLPNVADVVFVLGTIARAIPEQSKRESLIQEAQALVAKIATPKDQAERLQHLASSVKGSNNPLARRLIKEAFEVACSLGRTKDVDVLRRELVDTAYSFDPDFAESLIAGLDDDPARRDAKTAATRELRDASLRRGLDATNLQRFAEACVSPELPRLAWQHLGAMNSGRVGPTPLKQMRRIVESASDLRFSEAYPIYALAIENTKRCAPSSAEGNALIRAVFEATVVVSRLTSRLARTNSDDASRTGSVNPAALLIRAGARTAALDAIANFLRANYQKDIYLADPFLGPKEIAEFLLLARDANVSGEVCILTSRKHFESTKIPDPWSATIEEAWRSVSDSPSPTALIVIAGQGKQGDSPIHDRWLLCSDSGLRLGTSFNSLGDRRESELSYLNQGECAEHWTSVTQLASGRRRSQSGERIEINRFYL